jgi:hypothetical protein
VETGKRIILRTLRGMSTFEFLPRITFEGNVLKTPDERNDIVAVWTFCETITK